MYSQNLERQPTCQTASLVWKWVIFRKCLVEGGMCWRKKREDPARCNDAWLGINCYLSDKLWIVLLFKAQTQDLIFFLSQTHTNTHTQIWIDSVCPWGIDLFAWVNEPAVYCDGFSWEKALGFVLYLLGDNRNFQFFSFTGWSVDVNLPIHPELKTV